MLRFLPYPHILSSHKKPETCIRVRAARPVPGVLPSWIIPMQPFSLKKVIAERNNLARVLDSLKEGIIAHDLERRIYFINREAERITGCRADEVVGKDCHDVFGGPLCGLHCSFCGNQEVPEEGKEYTVTFADRGGEERRLEVSVTIIHHPKGDPAGVLASFRDVTDMMRLRRQAGELTGFRRLIGRDEKMLHVFEQIRNVAHYDFPVHIHGETGTGKELAASAIHGEGHHKDAPFVPINCGALPEGLIESELFGHVKGAFSGAIRDKKGRFQLADGGTIFLDEVAELSKPVQVKLLRFLQEGTFERVGGEETLAAKVKVISASNKDLKEEVRMGNFRDDLFYRLNVIPIHLPPLRKRKNDIPLLVDHFLRQAAERHNGRSRRISKQAVRILMDYHWPGNVRELQNAVQFAIVKSTGGMIRPKDLPLEMGSVECRVTRPGPVPKLDVDAVTRALKEAGGNKAKASRRLGVGRATLYRFLEKHPELEQ